MVRGATLQRGGDGSRAPVTGLDTVCEKLQLSDLRHMTHWQDQRAELSKAACIGVYRSTDGGQRKGEREREYQKEMERFRDAAR